MCSSMYPMCMSFINKPAVQSVGALYSRWWSENIFTCLFLCLWTNYWFIQWLESIKVESSSTSDEAFDDIHKVKLYVISSHVFSVVNHIDFVGMSTDDPKYDGCYILNLLLILILFNRMLLFMKEYLQCIDKCITETHHSNHVYGATRAEFTFFNHCPLISLPHGWQGWFGRPLNAKIFNQR